MDWSKDEYGKTLFYIAICYHFLYCSNGVGLCGPSKDKIRMNRTKFFLFLFLCLIFSWLIGNVMFTIQEKSKFFLSILSVFFMFFGIVVYEISSRASQSKNLYLFSQIFLISVLLKITLFVFIVILAIRKLGYDKKEIIIPALFIYLIFTIYETYFLMKISHQKLS